MIWHKVLAIATRVFLIVALLFMMLIITVLWAAAYCGVHF